MPKKKRRKLSREIEKEISLIKKEVELITAIIFDIDEEELQGEYMEAFHPVKVAALTLANEYNERGVTDELNNWLLAYKDLLNKFKSEFEI